MIVGDDEERKERDKNDAEEEKVLEPDDVLV